MTSRCHRPQAHTSAASRPPLARARHDLHRHRQLRNPKADPLTLAGRPRRSAPRATPPRPKTVQQNPPPHPYKNGLSGPGTLFGNTRTRRFAGRADRGSVVSFSQKPFQDAVSLFAVLELRLGASSRQQRFVVEHPLSLPAMEDGITVIEQRYGMPCWPITHMDDGTSGVIGPPSLLDAVTCAQTGSSGRFRAVVAPSLRNGLRSTTPSDPPRLPKARAAASPQPG